MCKPLCREKLRTPRSLRDIPRKRLEHPLSQGRPFQSEDLTSARSGARSFRALLGRQNHAQGLRECSDLERRAHGKELAVQSYFVPTFPSFTVRSRIAAFK